MRKIQKGDEVIVLAGKDKGRTGKVVSVDPSSNKLIVENINVAKKHVRANPQVGEPGGIVDREMPIQASNVAIYNAKTEKADRVGFKVDGDKKVRVYKSTGDVIA